MIEINNIVACYGNKQVLNGISLKIHKGEFCSILGPNGSGKSTLFKTVIGFHPLSKGDITFNKVSVNKLKPKELSRIVAIIPQEIRLQFDYTVMELVLMGRYPYLNYWQKYTDKDKQIVDKILFDLELHQYRHTNYSELSGGEKQRVNIARALAQNSNVILLDESLVHLDINHQLEIMHILAKINKEQFKTIVIVSHNINLSADYSNRLIVIKKGKVILDGSPEQIITQENIKTVFEAELAVVTNTSSGKPNIRYPGWSR